MQSRMLDYMDLSGVDMWHRLNDPQYRINNHPAKTVAEEEMQAIHDTAEGHINSLLFMVRQERAMKHNAEARAAHAEMQLSLLKQAQATPNRLQMLEQENARLKERLATAERHQQGGYLEN
eukprot:TRINITY_DN71253_c0_g1_i1.p1 TRINITY_DN71253_c0_g1~~TRINITY_DN71253_c0_g1_i1.p1  ORF type:complete len:121 (+),score=49.05 TRINITY_DN71253_c0_g1_i1:98-460(+)